MGDGQIVGFISLGILVCTNLVLTAYHYGRLSQTIADLCRRVDKLEIRINSRER